MTKSLCVLLYETETWSLTFRQVCLSPARHVAVDTKFCTVAPNICRFSVWNLLRVTLRARHVKFGLQTKHKYAYTLCVKYSVIFKITSRTYEDDEKCVQFIVWETRRKEATWKN